MYYLINRVQLNSRDVQNNRTRNKDPARLNEHIRNMFKYLLELFN